MQQLFASLDVAQVEETDLSGVNVRAQTSVLDVDFAMPREHVHFRTFRFELRANR